MKGKLHKMESGYILSLNGDIDDPYAIVNKELAEDYEWHKLSLPNCQAIELGFDLDELAEEFAKNHSIYPTAQDDTEYGFKHGFQKALEILGDKKFSEENLLKAFTVGLFSEFEKANYTKEYDDFLKSLQQTEWEVTFNPDEKDANGYLILKRIK